MKSHYFFILLLLSVLALAGLAGSSPDSSPNPTVLKSGSHAIPPEIFKVMENSCLACHGTGGKPVALSHLKLSKWDRYSSKKQVKKAAAICKMVSEHKMPLKSYLKDNPEKALTQAQIDEICAWTSSLKK